MYFDENMQITSKLILKKKKMKIFSFVPSQIESYLAEVVLVWSYSKLCLTAPPSIQEPQYN
jgi:hypothetical protein